MTVATPTDVIVNPNNLQQRYVLWGNGRIDALGGAPPITAQGTGPWFDRTDMPVTVAIWITNWATGAGYAFDIQGGYNTINGAPDITTTNSTTNITSNNNGLLYVSNRLYVDAVWDPANNGQGYALTCYGEILPFGGAPSPPRTGPRFSTAVARKLVMQVTPTRKIVSVDMFGHLYADFAAVVPTLKWWEGWDAARDLVVSNWNDPQSGYVLDLYGGCNAFGPTTSWVYGGPYAVGADNARTLSVISASNPVRLFEVWAQGQQFEWVSSTAPTVVAGNGLSEIQKVTITGTPTGGTFSLTFSGQTASGIAFNATAGVVQTALRGLSTIGSTGVTVTGGPGPGTPYTVTFGGSLALTNVAQMTSSAAFTGGASPAITVTTLTDGVTASPANTVTTTTRPVLSWAYTDPQQDSQLQWQVVLYTAAYVSVHPIINSNPLDPSALPGAVAYGTDSSPSTRGVVVDVDLTNTTYTYFVRSMDTSGIWSPWASRTWVQNVAIPATPTAVTAVANQATFTVALQCTAITGGTADTIQFQYSDDSGASWDPVRNADAVPLLATTTATDRDAPLGLARMYRAVAYSNNPRVASLTSGTATATLTKRTHVLTATDNAALGGEVNVVGAPSWTRNSKAGVFEGIGAQYVTVVSDGIPKGRKISLQIDTNSRAEWDLISNLVTANSTLVWRDPFGDVIYCRVVGDWGRDQKRRAPAATESTSLRHAHLTTIPLIEIAAPVSTGALSTVPPGPAAP